MNEPTVPTCPSCKIRYRIKPPEVRDWATPWQVSHRVYQWVENAARAFDEQAEHEAPGERFTAAEFVAWIRPEVVGKDAA